VEDSKLKIFLVGKIDQTDWRHSIVKGLSAFLEKLNPAIDGWPVMEGAIHGIHDYLGPYHAKIPKDAPEGVKTHRLCLKGISEADLVYCWFDDVEAYASLFEMGYAHALGKYTVVAYPKGFDRKEFWFMSCCVDAFMEVDSAVAGLMAAIMLFAQSGRIKNPEAELERVQRNLKRLEAVNGERASQSGGSTQGG
jgi:hypothetical protein